MNRNRTHISRRHFLQFATATLATLGLHPLVFQRQAQRYGQVLAQNTPRKLALLVGINRYPSRPLKGCVNDTELQRELLIYRFGFNPKDIYTLLDEKATRDGILTAFEEHLIKQAKPGDVVVYHYSGHGSRIFDPDPIFREVGNPQQLNGSFVPVDATLPVGYPEKGGPVKDIMGHTLFLLMSALQTENVTAVLDSCFAAIARRASSLSRAGQKCRSFSSGTKLSATVAVSIKYVAGTICYRLSHRGGQRSRLSGERSETTGAGT
jgi:hypothetical protein